MHLMPYTPDRLPEWHHLISAADQVDRANLGMPLESLRHLVSVTDPADICLAIESGRVIGYVRLQCQASQPTRVGCFGIVHPDHRQRGVGTALVRWALQRAQEYSSDGIPLVFYISVRHSVQGLEQLVNSLQMRPATYFHVLQYGCLPELPPEPKELVGISIRTYAGPADIRQLLQAHNLIFGQSITERELSHAAARPGFDPTLWLLAVAESSLIGFCTCVEDEDEAEVEYLGVLPAYRHLGLGAALLARSVRTLAQHGYHNIHLAVNVQNERALSLYHRAGFQPWRHSTTYELRFPAEQEALT